MLTLFSIPKAFRGHFNIIQRNAIQSWLRLQPACEVILFGNDEGVSEAAAELGARHIPEIARSEYGTPLLNDVFAQAERLTTYNLLCYVNADIILMNDFLQSVRQVTACKQWFLMVGQRWDLDIHTPLDFGTDWQDKLRAYTHQNGKPQTPAGMDYFVFPRGLYGEIPPFAIGRTYWDNWLTYRARAQKAVLIDASPVVMAIHQNHDYSHDEGGKNRVWSGPEAIRNRELLGGSAYNFALQDATHLLTPTGLKRAMDRWHLQRHIATLPLLYPYLPIRLFAKALAFSRPLRTRLGFNLYSGDSQNG